MYDFFWVFRSAEVAVLPFSSTGKARGAQKYNQKQLTQDQNSKEPFFSGDCANRRAIKNRTSRVKKSTLRPFPPLHHISPGSYKLTSQENLYQGGVFIECKQQQKGPILVFFTPNVLFFYCTPICAICKNAFAPMVLWKYCLW